MSETEPTRRAEMRPADALRWYLEAGVDEAIATEPVDRFNLPEPKPQPKPEPRPAALPPPERFAEASPSFRPAAPKPKPATSGVLESADVTAAARAIWRNPAGRSPSSRRRSRVSRAVP